MFESTTTKTFHSPNGFTYEPGSVVRGSTFINLNGAQVSLTLPSMAELIFNQAKESLTKAARLKTKALRTAAVNGHTVFVDESGFYGYMQLMSAGILGLYTSLETMVFELYIRKKANLVETSQEITDVEFSNLGFDRKMSSIAATLSGKPNIFATPLFDKANHIKSLRHTLQHWDKLIGNDYFMELPSEHPLKVYPMLDPLELIASARELLDHYSLG